MLGHCVGKHNENTVNYLSKAYESYFWGLNEHEQVRAISKFTLKTVKFTFISTFHHPTVTIYLGSSSLLIDIDR